MSSITALNGASCNGIINVKDAGLLGMITLRGDLKSKALAKALDVELGNVIPDQRKVSSTSKSTIAWMSPDELLIIIDYKNVSKIISNLNKSLTGTHSLVVDVSDARSVFSLDGTAIRDVLSKGSPANMSIDALPLGEVRRTRIAQLAVAFWFTDEMNCQLICFRSVGGYIMDWLKNASEPGSEVNFH
jgi:sarcosine oxidase subunit gamma